MLRSSSRRTLDRLTSLGLPTALPTWLSSHTETRLATFALPSAATSVVTHVGRTARSRSVRSRSSSAAERVRTSASGIAGPLDAGAFRFGGAIAPLVGMSLFTTSSVGYSDMNVKGSPSPAKLRGDDVDDDAEDA